MFWGVVDVQSLSQTPGLRGGKGFIEGGTRLRRKPCPLISDGAYRSSPGLDMPSSLALDRVKLAVRRIPSRDSDAPYQGRRYVVSAAFDPTVASHADAGKLLRTEPQVHLLWRF
jgi:hypothetical protein